MPPDVPISRLSYGERQRVEIIKALSLGARILIMDEPTTPPNQDRERGSVQNTQEMVSEGLAIIFVSHRIDEILSITDRVTVLRAGRVVGSGITKDLSREELVKTIVGSRVMEKISMSPREGVSGEGVAISVRGLHVMCDVGQVSVRGVDLDLYYGEILGVAGVEGNGQRGFLKP